MGENNHSKYSEEKWGFIAKEQVDVWGYKFLGKHQGLGGSDGIPAEGRPEPWDITGGMWGTRVVFPLN